MMKGYAAAAACHAVAGRLRRTGTPREPTKGHLTSLTPREARPANIPAPSSRHWHPKPRAPPKAETYSVVVTTSR